MDAEYAQTADLKKNTYVHYVTQGFTCWNIQPTGYVSWIYLIELKYVDDYVQTV